MPIRAFVSANPGLGSGGSTVTFTVPATAVVGDVALALEMLSNPSAITAPAGWTLLSGPDNNANNLVTNLYGKVLVSGDLGASFTWTAATSGRVLGAMEIVSQTTLTGLLVGGPTLDTTADSTLVPPVVTTAATPAEWEIVSFWALRANAASAATVTVPASHTKDGEVATGTGTAPNWTVGASHRTGGAASSTQYGTTSGTASASVTDNLYTLAVPSTSASPTVPAATASARATATAGVGPRVDAAPPAATALVTAKASAPVAVFMRAAVLAAVGGQYVRPGPSGGTPPAGTPTAPTTVRASMSGTTATVTWATPTSDGGAAITGYTVVNTTTGVTQNLGVVLTTTFTGLTAGAAYRFSVAAVNSAGAGAAALASVGATTAARFPGDPRPKVTGHMYVGLDEIDDDPTTVSPSTGEQAAPEAVAGVPCGAMRDYYSTSADASGLMAVPGGPLASKARAMHAKGRVPWLSITFGNWPATGDGRNDTVFLNWITYVEENLNAPVWFSPPHEPENNTAAGTEADWGMIAKRFRHQMDVYANAHGGVGVYKWKNLAFAPILTDYGYSRGDLPRAIGPFWRGSAYTTGVTVAASTDTFTATTHLLSNGCRVRLLASAGGLISGTDYYVVSATANTFKLAATRGGAAVDVTSDATGITVIYKDVYDFAGLDGYQFPLDNSQVVGRTGKPMWNGNFPAAFAWLEDPAHNYPVGIAETGVHYSDADAGTQLSIFYNKLMDGTHDIFACLYFNEHGGGTLNPGQFSLGNTRPDGGPNARLLDTFVAFMKDPRAVNFWETTATDGTPYPRPAGV